MLPQGLSLACFLVSMHVILRCMYGYMHIIAYLYTYMHACIRPHMHTVHYWLSALTHGTCKGVMTRT